MNQEIKLEYLHLCDFASPALMGKVNLLGIFDSFLAPQPKGPESFYIATKISVKTKAKYKISFEIQSNKYGRKIDIIDNKPIETLENFPQLSFNILKLMKNIDFKEFGEYKFIVLVNDLPVGFKQVEVKLL